MYREGDRCPVCGTGTLSKETVTETFEYKGRRFDYPGYVVYKCTACNESVVDRATLKESGRAVRDFYRKVDGLLVASEIKRIRKYKLCLTQDQASELLGGGAKSFARYENSEVIQSAALDNLLRVLDEAPHLINVLKKKNHGRDEETVVSFKAAYGPKRRKKEAGYGK